MNDEIQDEQDAFNPEAEEEEGEGEGEFVEDTDIEEPEEVAEESGDVAGNDETADEQAADEAVDSADLAAEPAEDQPRVSTFEPAFENDELNDIIRRCLAPVTPEEPCGEAEDKADSVVSQLETALDGISDRIKSNFGEALRDGNTAAFDVSYSGQEASELVEQVVECLEEHCKSIVVAAYLPQLLMILHGLPGFSAGMVIVREMIDAYRDQVHPREQEKLKGFVRYGIYRGNDDDVDEKYRLFLFMPVTEKSRLPYASLRNSRVKRANPETDAQYEMDARESTATFYDRLVRELDELVEASRSANGVLSSFLDDRECELASFKFLESIDRKRSIVHNLAEQNCDGYPIVEQPTDEQTPPGTVGVAPPVQAAAIGEIQSREQAITLLNKIAEYFQRTERHSPMSYSLKQVVKWSKMDLPQLLRELLNGESKSIEEIGRQVGFEPPEDEDD